MTIPNPPHVPVAGSSLGWLHISGILGLAALALVASVWCARRLKQQGHGTARQAPFRVTYSQALGPRERLVVVEIGEQQLLLGVTAQQITCLQHDRTTDALQDMTAPETRGGHFRTALLHCLNLRREGGKP